MIAVDATPLVVDPRRGVARALRARLTGWAAAPPAGGLVLLAPRPLDEDLPFEVRTPKRPARSPRAFRRRLPALLADAGATVLYSPFSAFPRTPLPVVVTVHELPFVQGGDAAEGWIRARRHQGWLARDVARAAAIVVPSAETRTDLLRWHPRAEPKVHLLPNAFDPAPWARAARQVEKAVPPILVAVGTGHRAAGHRKKGLDVLLAALRHLPGLRTVIVGRVRGPVPAGVEIRVDLDDEALARLVASASCLVHPARSEGFGYPPLEALAAGTPVVLTGGFPSAPGLAEAVVSTLAGEPASLAAGIRHVLEDEPFRRRLLQAGAACVRADAFDPAQGARRLTAVLAAAEAGR